MPSVQEGVMAADAKHDAIKHFATAMKRSSDTSPAYAVDDCDNGDNTDERAEEFERY
ncbi:MAG: hypothetical protein GY801_02245 [bacterium]|nr:hypothetical protein [bacterium]